MFVRFLGELKVPKRHFEINWPLDILKSSSLRQTMAENIYTFVQAYNSLLEQCGGNFRPSTTFSSNHKNSKPAELACLFVIGWNSCRWLSCVTTYLLPPLKRFPPLNSFRTFMYCDQRSQYIRPISKKNGFRGNYSRKYGICFWLKNIKDVWSISWFIKIRFWIQKYVGPIVPILRQDSLIF